MTEAISIKQDPQGMRILMLGTFHLFPEDWMLETKPKGTTKEVIKTN
jgi:hypothetical protein